MQRFLQNLNTWKDREMFRFISDDVQNIRPMITNGLSLFEMVIFRGRFYIAMSILTNNIEGIHWYIKRFIIAYVLFCLLTFGFLFIVFVFNNQSISLLTIIIIRVFPKRMIWISQFITTLLKFVKIKFFYQIKTISRYLL